MKYNRKKQRYNILFILITLTKVFALNVTTSYAGIVRRETTTIDVSTDNPITVSTYNVDLNLSSNQSNDGSEQSTATTAVTRDTDEATIITIVTTEIPYDNILAQTESQNDQTRSKVENEEVTTIKGDLLVTESGIDKVEETATTSSIKEIPEAETERIFFDLTTLNFLQKQEVKQSTENVLNQTSNDISRNKINISALSNETNYLYVSNISNTSVAGEKRGKFIQGEPINMTIPDKVEVWALAGMKSVNHSSSTKENPKDVVRETSTNVTTKVEKSNKTNKSVSHQRKNERNETIATKLVLDWSHIMKNVDMANDLNNNTSNMVQSGKITQELEERKEKLSSSSETNITTSEKMYIEHLEQGNSVDATVVENVSKLSLPEKTDHILDTNINPTLSSEKNLKGVEEKLDKKSTAVPIDTNQVDEITTATAAAANTTTVNILAITEIITTTTTSIISTLPSNLSNPTTTAGKTISTENILLMPRETTKAFSLSTTTNDKSLSEMTTQLPKSTTETTTPSEMNLRGTVTPTSYSNVIDSEKSIKKFPVTSTENSLESPESKVFTTLSTNLKDDIIPKDVHFKSINSSTMEEVFETTTYVFHPRPSSNTTLSQNTDYNVIIAITVSVIGIIALILLVGFLYVMRKRQKQLTYGQRCRPVSLDAYSLDNVSVYNSVRGKGGLRASKKSYGNVAFDDPSLKHNVLGTHELSKFIERKSSIFEEFKHVPQIYSRADEVPSGCEDKNRYANVIPLPETRVMLQKLNEDERTEYINANFVRGPKDTTNYYIATQGPLESTVPDFWRMIWEHSSYVIIMATDLYENGIEKCAEYLPTSITLDNHVVYGDFQVTLKSREVKEKYVVSTLVLTNLALNANREITHFWYQWPETGVPSDETGIIAMLLEARSALKLGATEQSDSASDDLSQTNDSNDKTKKSNIKPQGPLTVHCSPGTGRTGTIIACDIVLRSLELPKRTIDIPQFVYYVRRGRASSVQTKEQYEFIYRVAHMYATKITGPVNDN